VIIGTACQFDPQNNWSNVSYSAQVTNNCIGAVNGTLQFFVDATAMGPPAPGPTDPSWTLRASGTPFPASLAPGVPQIFSGTITGIVFPATDVFYRVRMVFDQGNGCIFTFYSDPDFVCTSTLQPTNPTDPVNPPKPKSSAPDHTTSFQLPNAFHLLSRHW